MSLRPPSSSYTSASVNDKPESLLWEQYRVVIDEYRFQVDLNWKRSQYYFVLNAAILAASLGLFASSVAVPRMVIAIPFLFGLAITLLAIAANRTQKGYYYAIRDKKRLLELRLGLGELAIQTTHGMGNRSFRRIGRVTTFQVAVLSVLAVADLAGIAAAFTVERSTASSGSTSTLSCQLIGSQPKVVKSVDCRIVHK